MKNKCATKFCTNERGKNRLVCHCCRSKKFRKEQPMKASFQTLRYNARRRGKEFSLTFEQFEKFCYETNYIAGRGRQKTSFSIDRIDNNKGYSIDNIRVLSVSDNSRRNKILVYDWETQYARVV